MSLRDLEKEVQALSPEELHEFSRWLGGYVAGLPNGEAQKAAIGEGVRRMEAIIQGQAAGQTKRPARKA
ncbi:MAG TPA: hypothetical protein VG734_01380 [Lacunisphaera sp.]|nr:hypothetical protein [Lacunisphaera sp.]